MIPELRHKFNQAWTPALYSEFLQELVSRCDTAPGFRISETPLFLPTPLLEKMVRYGRELYAQLASNLAYRQASEAAIPAQFRVPNEDEHPLFIQADFGLVREHDGSFEPKLVEIQGFPSIYGLQIAFAESYQEAYSLDSNLTVFLDGLDKRGYVDFLKRAILANHDPKQVVLLEIDPFNQKTSPDFIVTQKLLGLQIAGVDEVERRGRKLYFKGIEIKRIYNRVIVDELVRRKIQMQFTFTDDLDVEWAGHPNWFFRLSKFSLPWFRHVSVPDTWFLDDVKKLPAELDQYVLKPLYSFAGLGVIIGPSKEEIDAIPSAERHNYILQRKMDFAATIETPSGMTKAEIRIMYVHEAGELKAMTTVVRTGRGKMMGVDFNRNLDWVGASAGFYKPG